MPCELKIEEQVEHGDPACPIGTRMSVVKDGREVAYLWFSADEENLEIMDDLQEYLTERLPLYK